MLKSAMDVLATGDLFSIVDFAIETNRILSTTSKDLGVVKAHLRRLAETRRKSEPALRSVQFEGHLGIAHVVMPTKLIFRARRGMNLSDLKQVLPEEMYTSLFKEKLVVEVSDDYGVNFADLSPGQRLVVEKFVEGVAQTSRVNLPE